MKSFAIFTALAALTGAVNVKRQDPSGNPTIFPAMGQGVTAGQAFEIKWTPTTPGPVEIFLCVGPSTNCVNQAAPLAASIPNSGSFSWIPALSLLPTNGQGYGIYIKDLTTGDFQWTPQFGIVNPHAGNTIVISQVSTAPVVSSTEAPVVPSSTSLVHSWAPTATGNVSVPIVAPTAAPTLPSSFATKPTHAPSAPVVTPPPSNGAAKVGGSMAAVFGLVLAALAL